MRQTLWLNTASFYSEKIRVSKSSHHYLYISHNHITASRNHTPIDIIPPDACLEFQSKGSREFSMEMDKHCPHRRKEALEFCSLQELWTKPSGEELPHKPATVHYNHYKKTNYTHRTQWCKIYLFLWMYIFKYFISTIEYFIYYKIE